MFTISYAKALDLILHNPVRIDDSLLVFTALTDDDELYYNEDGAIITFPKKLNEKVQVRDGRIILKGMDKEDYLFEILQYTKVTPEFEITRRDEPYKLHDPEDVESFTIKVTKKKFPKVWNCLLEEFESICENEEEALSHLESLLLNEIELELYYDPNFGMFAVEADAIENGARIFSPYSKTEFVNSKES